MLFCIYLEEISICVRFVHTREDNKKVQVRKEFLGFVQADSTTGQAEGERFLGTQQGYGLDIDRMRAQGHGGAANTRGFTEVPKQLSRIAYQTQFMSIVRLIP